MNASPIVRNLYRPLSLMILAACLAMGIAGIVNLAPTHWNAPFFATFCAFIALEAYYSERASRAYYTLGGLRPHLVELGGLFLVLQVATDLTDGRAPLHHSSPVISGVGVGYAVVAGILWLLTYDASSELERLGEPPGHDTRYVPPQRVLWLRFLAGIAVLVIASAFVELQTQAKPGSEAGVLPPPVSLFIYALTGILLLAQANYSSLSATWQESGVVLAEGMVGRWARYTLGFVALIVFLSFFMPAAGASQLVEALSHFGQALDWLERHSLSSAQRSGHGITGFSHATPSPVRGKHKPPPPSHLPNILPGVELIAAVLIVGGVALFMWRVLQEGGRTGSEQRGFWARLRAALGKTWRGLLQWLHGTGSELAAVLPGVPAMAQVASSSPLARLFRRKPSTARGRIIQYYLDVLTGAKRMGYERRRGQTPHEFEEVLVQAAPDTRDSASALTNTFLEARYSSHPVEQSSLARMREAWRRLREALPHHG